MTTTTISSLDKQELVAQIRWQTARANRNNVTRTQAYLDFYREHPEIHWALLAHLVSRNGGWNMTDLKGEWLPAIMDAQEIKPFFWLLERSNWLIFHDAYPQLLLYAQMKQRQEDLSALLKPLGVSVFMHSYWQEFLASQESSRLTRALIVNEQQYIEQRVVHKPLATNRVFSTYVFFTQSLFSLNQILFPYKAHPTDKRLNIVGLNVQHFSELTQRIAIGKTLYRLLFDDPYRLDKIVTFCTRIPHTGSRADYWPHLFTPRQLPQAKAKTGYELRLKGDNLISGKPKLYSPALQTAWADVEHAPADGVDWFRDEKWRLEVEKQAELPLIDTDAYIRALHWTEYGVKLVTAIT
ncbi:DUF2515 family protein [Brevibacillus parabrevis]|uniref:DUF2515 family protein n=1 Tax=Brevibacillus parabrevis TaxID=54914 RepID=UPI00113409BE|nr:DUF2515 family protein [Brevibacillus parabrevis]TGV29346.1 DUF2515 domain-containing protein [Mesorhizobium sp. M00.F.Ca.ET.186.01.1.1]